MAVNSRISALPDDVEVYRDRMWRREAELRVEDAVTIDFHIIG